MWLMIERISLGVVVRNYFRSKEEADEFLSRPGRGKVVNHKLVERHCGKLVTDPPEPRLSVPELEPEEDDWNEEDIDDLEIAEEYYLDPEVDVDDWDDYTDSDYEEDE
jgi:hypothetical protein